MRHKIGGRAKAMVATSSRSHAVRHEKEFDPYLAEMVTLPIIPTHEHTGITAHDLWAASQIGRFSESAYFPKSST